MTLLEYHRRMRVSFKIRKFLRPGSVRMRAWRRILFACEYCAPFIRCNQTTYVHSNFVRTVASQLLYPGVPVVVQVILMEVSNSHCTIHAFTAQVCLTMSASDLILKHLPQVRLLARRIHGRLPESVSLDDLVSTGIVGLISAIDRFDPSRHVQLRAYAEHKIKGGILDSLRRLDWAPRQQRKRARQIQTAIAAVEQRLQRAPTEQEIAAELGITVDRYREWQVNGRGLNLERLETESDEFPETRAAPLPFRRSGRATVRRF